MKRLAIVTFMAFVSLMSFAQDDASNSTEMYLMKAYLSNGTATIFCVGSVDSVVYNVASLCDNGSVDLGLSVKWAACNIGADSPEDYGNYYAWGETETKDEYTSSNSVTSGVEMDDISGNAEYDAATANWGGSWRMPTNNETEELVNNCTWTWAILNDVNGFLVTGSNGNSIFLPAAGNRMFTDNRQGERGYYWSSTPIETDTNYFSNCLFFTTTGVSATYTASRELGRTIRPVTD